LYKTKRKVMLTLMETAEASEAVARSEAKSILVTVLGWVLGGKVRERELSVF
jgi:hypothetical protein